VYFFLVVLLNHAMYLKVVTGLDPSLLTVSLSKNSRIIKSSILFLMSFWLGVKRTLSCEQGA